MLDSIESVRPAPSCPMAKAGSKKTTASAASDIVAGQGDRLKRLRETLGYMTATAFADFLEIGITRYHPFEKGVPLSRDVAFLIVRKVPGVSLDWLYFGKPDGLPLELARRLGVFGNRTTD